VRARANSSGEEAREGLLAAKPMKRLERIRHTALKRYCELTTLP